MIREVINKLRAEIKQLEINKLRAEIREIEAYLAANEGKLTEQQVNQALERLKERYVLLRELEEKG